MMTKSFGSQIRGGESSCRVRISTEPLLNPVATWMCRGAELGDFLKFGGELPVSGSTVVIYGAPRASTPTDSLVGVTPLQVIGSFSEMAKTTAGTERAKNTVVLGLIASWFGIGRKLSEGFQLASKARGVAANERAFNEGIKFRRTS